MPSCVTYIHMSQRKVGVSKVGNFLPEISNFGAKNPKKSKKIEKKAHTLRVTKGESGWLVALAYGLLFGMYVPVKKQHQPLVSEPSSADWNLSSGFAS